MDCYQVYSCLAARELVVPILPLGQKMQLRPAKQQATKHQKGGGRKQQTGNTGAAIRCCSTQLCAQPSCTLCRAMQRGSPAQVYHMLRGRDSPVREALQDCWFEAARTMRHPLSPERQVTAGRQQQQHGSDGRMHSKKQRQKLELALQALDLAASRLREKLSAAQATVATAITAPKPPGAPSADAFGAASGATASGKQRLHSTGVMASAAPTSTDSPRRHWIP